MLAKTLVFPLSTLEVCDLIGITEYSLNNSVRSRKIAPPMPIRGRRYWSKADVLAAAKAIGKLTPEIEANCKDAQ